MQSPNGRQAAKTGDLLGLSSSGKSPGALIDVGGDGGQQQTGGVDLLAGGVPEDTFNKYVRVIVSRDSLVFDFLIERNVTLCDKVSYRSLQHVNTW